MGLDVAVEFATLGEFRLVDPAWAEVTPAEVTAAPLMRRPERKAAIHTDKSILPAPATALGRASTPDRPSAPKRGATPDLLGRPVPRPDRPARPGIRLEHAPRRRGGQPASAPSKRTRAGTVQPAGQLCLAV